MVIDSVVWAQYINVTNTETDSHVAIANAALTHCVGRAAKSDTVHSSKLRVYEPIARVFAQPRPCVVYT